MGAIVLSRSSPYVRRYCGPDQVASYTEMGRLSTLEAISNSGSPAAEVWMVAEKWASGVLVHYRATSTESLRLHTLHGDMSSCSCTGDRSMF